ncbi:hypothetical protein GL50803_0010850 [Giardia duodenalis]|uniref:Uncharacterized protein n=1 Tax=Giardia intestinalis (strain ATCC 50803 / WB clone C6) TaxID=184922 RepID=A8B796_GIAIC|nr:hypothetical protein GL50803_0010850 [Giardia intestinalis]KAE8301751.1 hypothetical protein GL50803_0010850 [Giardia intestinalis]|eukprot:XP_001709174.1 Hypothetical protein GL50803_10850 [Giardia lamblia ATCC 50803]
MPIPEVRRQLAALIKAVQRGEWPAILPPEITAKDYSILVQYISNPDQRVEATRKLAGLIVDLKTNARLLLDSNPFATEKEQLRQIFREQEQLIPNASIGCSFSRRSLLLSHNTSRASVLQSQSASFSE